MLVYMHAHAHSRTLIFVFLYFLIKYTKKKKLQLQHIQNCNITQLRTHGIIGYSLGYKPSVPGMNQSPQLCYAINEERQRREAARTAEASLLPSLHSLVPFSISWVYCISYCCSCLEFMRKWHISKWSQMQSFNSCQSQKPNFYFPSLV